MDVFALEGFPPAGKYAEILAPSRKQLERWTVKQLDGDSMAHDLVERVVEAARAYVAWFGTMREQLVDVDEGTVGSAITWNLVCTTVALKDHANFRDDMAERENQNLGRVISQSWV